MSGQLLDSSRDSYMATLSRLRDSSQATWTNNHFSSFCAKIESESATPGIPVTYSRDYPSPQLRDLLLPPRVNVHTAESESKTAHSSEIPSMYNHASPTYNHVQSRDLLLASRAPSSSAQNESETPSSEITPAPHSVTLRGDDVTAVTSHPVSTSPTGVADLRVKLCNAQLWRQFHACTNEMIITKAGRQDTL